MEPATIARIEERLRAQCGALDPDAVPLPEAPGLFRDLDRIARLATGAKLRLLRKLDDAGVATSSGDRSTAEWAARETGTTVGAAREALSTSSRLGDQRATDEALAKGDLSEEQANAISDAAAADPDAEGKLVDAAKKESVRELKDRCARTKANAHPDQKARREAIRKARYLRTFRDREGAWNLQMRHLPEIGAEIESIVAKFTHQRFEDARQCNQRESQEAYRADAMLDLARAANGGGTAAPKGARRAEIKLFVHIDHETLVSGRVSNGTRCEIDGIGPVDIDWVRSILGEAFVVALIEDAVDVRAIVHLGRQATAHQRSAMEARGYRCEVPGCGVRHNLEIDHVDDWHRTFRTTLDQLAWECSHHHDLKTHHGYRLSGPYGARTWSAPDGGQVRERPPPDAGDTRPPVARTLFADPSAA